jgi:soluble lytic murein transglycosylase-like protein
MNRRRHVRIKALPAVLLAGVLGSMTACGSGTVTVENASAAAPAAVAASEPAPRLSEQTLAVMKEDGSTVAPASPEDAEAAVPADEAAKTASEWFARLTQKRSPDELVLARVTNTQYKELLNPELRGKSEKRLIVNDRLCWVSVFNKVPVAQTNAPVLSELEPDGKPNYYTPQPVEFVDATLVVLVDAKTGKFVRGVSI